MSSGRFAGIGNLVYVRSTSNMSSAVNPAAAAFHSDRFEMRYVWMCSGLFSSSANGARASRASAYFGFSTSTRTDRSDWTMNGLLGSNEGGAAAWETAASFGIGGMVTVCRMTIGPEPTHASDEFGIAARRTGAGEAH